MNYIMVKPIIHNFKVRFLNCISFYLGDLNPQNFLQEIHQARLHVLGVFYSQF